MRRISIISVTTIIIYFVSVLSFLITKADIALTIWELMTVIGAIVYLFLIVKLSDIITNNNFYKRLISVFMGCGVAFTSVAHIVNITVTRRLISDGINIPDYFRIGCWPSVEMVVDYLGWGLFVGLAFLLLGVSINDKKYNSIKMASITSGILCLIGFNFALFINENMWYIATVGYGIIPIYLCVKTMKIKSD